MSKLHKSVFDMTDDELKEHMKWLFSDANKVEYRKLHDTDNVEIGYRQDKPVEVAIQSSHDCSQCLIDYDEWLDIKSELMIDESTVDVYDIVSDYMDPQGGFTLGYPPSDVLSKRWY